MLRVKHIRNATDGNGTLFRGDMYQIPMNGLLGGATGQRIWEVNLVPQYSPGTRLVTEDGRVFRYAKANNIVSVRQFGLKFWGQIADGIAAVAAGTHAIGDKTVMLTGTATKDEYKGGYLIIHSSPNQVRSIISNTATAGTTFSVTLGEPLTVAVTGAATYCEALQSPYSNVRLCAGPSGGDSGNEWSSVAGIPYTITAAADTYLWLQTWGPMWVNPAGGSLLDAGVAVNERQLVFDFEGSVIIVGDATASTVSMQHAGFIIDRNYGSTSGPPLVMLQISP